MAGDECIGLQLPNNLRLKRKALTKSMGGEPLPYLACARKPLVKQFVSTMKQTPTFSILQVCLKQQPESHLTQCQGTGLVYSFLPIYFGFLNIVWYGNSEYCGK